ncbi:hypothetical protein GF343_02745 [Candidatus Woesearchaeota archaeon]|nr:hypothetical protein [Candidatus Woesearchaeota archaeon]
MGFFSRFFKGSKPKAPAAQSKKLPREIPPGPIPASSEAAAIIAALVGTEKTRLVLSDAEKEKQGMLDKLVARIHQALSDENIEAGVAKGADTRTIKAVAGQYEKSASENVFEMKKYLVRMLEQGLYSPVYEVWGQVVRRFFSLRNSLMNNEYLSGIYEHGLANDFAQVLGQLITLEEAFARAENEEITKFLQEYGELAEKNQWFQRWLRVRLADNSVIREERKS